MLFRSAAIPVLHDAYGEFSPVLVHKHVAQDVQLWWKSLWRQHARRESSSAQLTFELCARGCIDEAADPLAHPWIWLLGTSMNAPQLASPSPFTEVGVAGMSVGGLTSDRGGRTAHVEAHNRALGAPEAQCRCLRG